MEWAADGRGGDGRKKRIFGDGLGGAFRLRGRTKELAEFGLAREGVAEFAGGSGAVVYGEESERVERRGGRFHSDDLRFRVARRPV